MCSNHFKMANLKQLKIRIVHLFLSFSNSLAPYVFRTKQLPAVRKFAGGVHFKLGFEHSCDITSALFDRGGRVY